MTLLLLAVKSQAAVPGLNLGANNTVPWTIVFTLTLLTLLPAIVLSMTPMVRLLVVFHSCGRRWVRRRLRRTRC